MSIRIDPLSLIREFHKDGISVLENDGKITFGENSWPKTAKTNFLINKKNGPKEYYTLECILYFLKNSNLNHAEYCKQAAKSHIPSVRRLDRKELLAYLNGEINTSASIDKKAPIAIPITDGLVDKGGNQGKANKRYSYEVHVPPGSLDTRSKQWITERDMDTTLPSLQYKRGHVQDIDRGSCGKNQLPSQKPVKPLGLDGFTASSGADRSSTSSFEWHVKRISSAGTIELSSESVCAGLGHIYRQNLQKNLKVLAKQKAEGGIQDLPEPVKPLGVAGVTGSAGGDCSNRTRFEWHVKQISSADTIVLNSQSVFVGLSYTFREKLKKRIKLLAKKKAKLLARTQGLPSDEVSTIDKSLKRGTIKFSSDGLTPSPQIQNVKGTNELQPHSFNAAPNTRNLAIVCDGFPTVKLSQTQYLLIQKKILDLIDAIPEGEPVPEINNSDFSKGAFIISCNSPFTEDWVKQHFEGDKKTASGMTLKVIKANDCPKPIIIMFKTRDVLTKDQDILFKRLSRHNPHLRSAQNWRAQRYLGDHHSTKWIIEVEKEDLENIKKSNFRAYTGLDCGTFKILSNPSKDCNDIQMDEASADAAMSVSTSKPATQLNECMSDSNSIEENVSNEVSSTVKRKYEEQNQQELVKKPRYEVLKSLSNDDFNENEIPIDPQSLSLEKSTEFKSFYNKSKVDAGEGRLEEALESLKKAVLICRSEKVVNHIKNLEVLKSLSNGDFNENEILTDPKSLSPEKLTEFKSFYQKSKVDAGEGRLEEALESLKKAALICRSEKVVNHIKNLEALIEQLNEDDSNSKTINENVENEISSTEEKNQQENLEKPFPQDFSANLNVGVSNSKSIDENVSNEISSTVEHTYEEQNQPETIEKILP